MRSVFPLKLKPAEVTPVFKNGSNTEKENYRPVSVLSNISKIYERLIFQQISSYFEKILSKYQCGFRKGYSAQHCLIAMIEKWRKSADNGGVYGAVLTDLSKAFDCLPHDLLIAKLYAYGCEITSTKFIYSYLSNRSQCIKIDKSFSSWNDIISGVPQGSILGPLLFNIFISDIFYCIPNIDIASYADDNTPYTCGDDLNTVLESLESSTNTLFKWFSDNSMKSNAKKCHLLTKSDNPVSVKIGDTEIINSNQEKLLGINIDCSLTFETHVNQICKKASQKLSAISRISSFMNITQRKLIVNAFFKSQFNYCPLVCMNHSRNLNNKINRLHERCLRMIYNDNKSSFQELLERDKSVTIHHHNIQTFATELYKIRNNLSPLLMKEIFPFHDPEHNLRSDFCFLGRNVKTVKYGTDSLIYLAPKIWNLIPSEIKESNNLQAFKSKIKNWIPSSCPCRLCKTYIQGIGFL